MSKSTQSHQKVQFHYKGRTWTCKVKELQRYLKEDLIRKNKTLQAASDILEMVPEDHSERDDLIVLNSYFTIEEESHSGKNAHLFSKNTGELLKYVNRLPSILNKYTVLSKDISFPEHKRSYHKSRFWGLFRLVLVPLLFGLGYWGYQTFLGKKTRIASNTVVENPFRNPPTKKELPATEVPHKHPSINEILSNRTKYPFFISLLEFSSLREARHYTANLGMENVHIIRYLKTWGQAKKPEYTHFIAILGFRSEADCMRYIRANNFPSGPPKVERLRNCVDFGYDKAERFFYHCYYGIPAYQ